MCVRRRTSRVSSVLMCCVVVFARRVSWILGYLDTWIHTRLVTWSDGVMAGWGDVFVRLRCVCGGRTNRRWRYAEPGSQALTPMYLLRRWVADVVPVSKERKKRRNGKLYSPAYLSTLRTTQLNIVNPRKNPERKKGTPASRNKQPTHSQRLRTKPIHNPTSPSRTKTAGNTHTHAPRPRACSQQQHNRQTACSHTHTHVPTSTQHVAASLCGRWRWDRFSVVVDFERARE